MTLNLSPALCLSDKITKRMPNLSNSVQRGDNRVSATFDKVDTNGIKQGGNNMHEA